MRLTWYEDMKPISRGLAKIFVVRYIPHPWQNITHYSLEKILLALFKESCDYLSLN